MRSTNVAKQRMPSANVFDWLGNREERMCEARMLRSNECLRRMSSTGWEIEFVNIGEAVIELVRLQSQIVIT